MSRVACTHVILRSPEASYFIQAKRPQTLLMPFEAGHRRGEFDPDEMKTFQTNLATCKTNANRAALIAHIVLSVFCALALAAAVAATLLVPGLAVGLAVAAIAVPLVTAALGNLTIHLLNRRQQNKTLADQIEKELASENDLKPEEVEPFSIQEYLKGRIDNALAHQRWKLLRFIDNAKLDQETLPRVAEGIDKGATLGAAIGAALDAALVAINRAPQQPLDPEAQAAADRELVPERD